MRTSDVWVAGGPAPALHLYCVRSTMSRTSSERPMSVRSLGLSALASPGKLKTPAACEGPQAGNVCERLPSRVLSQAAEAMNRRCQKKARSEGTERPPKPTPNRANRSQPSCLYPTGRYPRPEPGSSETETNKGPHLPQRHLRPVTTNKRIENGRACDEGFHYGSGRQDL